MFKKMLLQVFTLVIFLPFAGPASAAQLFSNLLPETIINDSSACVGQFNGPLNTGSLFENNGTQSVTLSLARVKVMHDADAAATLTLSAFADNAGIPGALIATGSTISGTGLGTTSVYQFSFAPAAVIPATSRFWLVLNTSSASFCPFSWNGYPNPSVGTVSGLSSSQLYDGTWSNIFSGVASAELDGTIVTPPVQQVNSIPVDSPLWLALTMLLILAGYYFWPNRANSVS